MVALSNLDEMRVVIVLVLILATVVYCRKLPSFIEVCHRHEPKMQECLMKNVEILKPKFKNGIPELHIPSMDPLMVTEATVKGGENFQCSFSDIKIYNFDEFVVESFDAKLDKNDLQLEASLRFPHVRVKSDYKVDGKILILQLKGEGIAEGNYTNIFVHFITTAEIVNRNGKEYIQVIDKKKFELTIEKTRLQFDNIFGDNQELNKQTNKIINDNADALVKEMTPLVAQTVTKFVFGVLTEIFNMFSYDELFPDP